MGFWRNLDKKIILKTEGYEQLDQSDLDEMRNEYISKEFETIKERLIYLQDKYDRINDGMVNYGKVSFRKIGEFDEETPEYIIVLAREREYYSGEVMKWAKKYK